MKNLLCIITILNLFFISCSKDNSTTDVPKYVPLKTFIKVTPLRVETGDTITFEGNNLDRIWLKFNDFTTIRIVSQQYKKIVAIVPDLKNENIVVKAMLSQTFVSDSINLTLYGFFPLIDPVNNGDITHVKAVNENIVFATVNSQLLKSVDGGYHWINMKIFSGSISSLCFIDENNGWVGTENNCLYYTNDGGKSFSYLFKTDQSMGGNFIMDMDFSSSKHGYLLTGKGEIYSTNDNSVFTLLYAFPESNRESGYIEFFHLSVYNNIVMATGESGKNGNLPVLIKGMNDVFTYQTFSEQLRKVKIVNEHKSYLIKGSKLYVTNNNGNSWDKVSDTMLFNIYFLDENNGFGITSDEYLTHHIILQTNDGGNVWKKRRELYDSEYVMEMTFIGKVGYVSGYRSQMWKYIKD